MTKKIVISLLLLSSSLLSKDYIIDQKEKTFIPHELKVKVGDSITFKNSDPFAHNAYTDDDENEFDIGMQKPGMDITIPIKAKGSFNIECAIHPNMLVEVEAN